MKKQLLIIISIAMIIAIIVAFANISMAGGTGCDLQLNPSASTVNPGDELVLTVRIKNITVTQGISGLSGTLQYDTNAFEPISYEVVSNNWEEHSKEVDTVTPSISVITTNGKGVTTDQDVMKVKFKVKNTATAKSYTFKIINAESKPVEAQVTQEFQTPITTSVTVKGAVTPTNNIVNNTTVNNVVVNNTVENNTVVNNILENNIVANNTVDNNTEVKNKTVVNTNSSNSKVPNTGVKIGLGVMVFIAIIAALAAGIRYKKFNSMK